MVVAAAMAAWHAEDRQDEIAKALEGLQLPGGGSCPGHCVLQ